MTHPDSFDELEDRNISLERVLINIANAKTALRVLGYRTESAGLNDALSGISDYLAESRKHVEVTTDVVVAAIEYRRIVHDGLAEPEDAYLSALEKLDQSIAKAHVYWRERNKQSRQVLAARSNDK